MHLTQALRSAPVFRFWKHFGAGLQKRQPNFKQWKYKWYAHINRRKIPDHTIPKTMLPPGSRVMEVDELLAGPIEAMPDELIKMKHQQHIVYDHPWPYDVRQDPIKSQPLMYCYDLDTRFFTPKLDCLVLTNTLLESDQLEPSPPIEPNNENIEYLRRHYDWAAQADSVLVRLPRQVKDWPKVNLRPMATFGLTKERTESNLINIMSNYTQMLLTKHYHEQADETKLNAILSQRCISYPHCQVPFEREPGKRINLNLFIDSMLISKQPLPQIDHKPAETKSRPPLDIKPRTWKSLLEQSRNYSPAWSFALPRNAHIHTIQLNSHIKRNHRDAHEMLARSIVHAFGVASQFARLQALAAASVPADLGSPTTDFHASCIVHDPLGVGQVNDKDILDKPVVVQTISYDHQRGEFDFLRYQLNTLNFDDSNPARVKNQAWHSGPISDIDKALRYYLDFHSFDVRSTAASRMVGAAVGGGPASGPGGGAHDGDGETVIAESSRSST
jgi:hypothetical protein